MQVRGLVEAESAAVVGQLTTTALPSKGERIADRTVEQTPPRTRTAAVAAVGIYVRIQ